MPKRISTKDLAYAAGFFDGEGTVGIYRSGKDSVGVRLAITNTYRPVLCWFASRFNGRVKSHNSGTYSNANWRKPYYWALYGQNAKSFMELILPLLKEKKKQVQLSLSFYALSPAQKKKSKIPQRLKELKRIQS